MLVELPSPHVFYLKLLLLRDKYSSVILSERRETDSSKWFLDIFCEESDGFVRNIANMNLILTEFADLEALHCHNTTGNILLQKWKILPIY